MSLEFVEAPKQNYPTASEIEDMSKEDQTSRNHFFITMFVLVFFATQALGTGMMYIGSRWDLAKRLKMQRRKLEKAERARRRGASIEEVDAMMEADDTIDLLKEQENMAWDAPESDEDDFDSNDLAKELAVLQDLSDVETQDKEDRRVMSWTPRVVAITVTLCLVTTISAMKTGRLSQSSGLDWEVYLALFSFLAAWLLLQAGFKVRASPIGFVFGITAFLEASLPSFFPLTSDFYDTLKDCLFGAFCLQSDRALLKVLGVLSWLWIVFVHVKLLTEGGFGRLELSVTYASVWRARGKPCQARKQSIFEQVQAAGKAAAVAALRQTTPSKLQMILWENLPQAIFAVIYTALEGSHGSKLPAVLNVAVPLAQLVGGVLLRPVFRWAAGTSVFEKFMIAQRGKHCQFASPEALFWIDSMGPSMWRYMDLEDRGIILDHCDLNDAHVEALAATLPRSAVEYLDLQKTGISDYGFEALVAILPQTNINRLFVPFAVGSAKARAEALAAALPHSAVAELRLRGSSWPDIWPDMGVVEALAATLPQTKITEIYLSAMDLGDRGKQALANALRQSQVRLLQLEHCRLGKRSVGQALRDVEDEKEDLKIRNIEEILMER